MSAIFIFKPHSRSTQWLMSLTIKPGLTRVISTIKKLSRLYQHAQVNQAQSSEVLQQCQQRILQIEVYYDKEIARLSRRIKRHHPEKIEFKSKRQLNFRVPVTTPVAVRFFQLIKKHDILMCLIEIYALLGLFKNRGNQNLKQRLYTRKLLKLMAGIGEFKLAHNTALDLLEHDKNSLP